MTIQNFSILLVPEIYKYLYTFSKIALFPRERKLSPTRVRYTLVIELYEFYGTITRRHTATS